MKVSSNVRNIKGIDSVSFANDISSSLGDLDFDDGSVDDMLGRFDSCILSVLNTHAPLQQRTRSIKPTSPWFDETIRDARRKRRQCERKYLKSKNQCDHDEYVAQSNITSKLVQSAKESYYQENLENSNNKNMFQTLNQLLNNVTKQLPDFGSLNETCNNFARFFDEKVSKIRQDLDNIPGCDVPGIKP